MTDPNVPVSKNVQSAAKAVAATLASLSGLVALFLTAAGDGSVSAAEGGTLLTAALTAVATVVAVYTKRNK